MSEDNNQKGRRIFLFKSTLGPDIFFTETTNDLNSKELGTTVQECAEKCFELSKKGEYAVICPSNFTMINHRRRHGIEVPYDLEVEIRDELYSKHPETREIVKFC